MGGVLALGMTAAVIPSASLSVLADFLVRDLDLSHAQIGMLITTFSAAGALWSPLAGRLSDWVGGRTILDASFIAVALEVILFAAAPNFMWMLAILVFAGFANGASNPATNKIVTNDVPIGRRGTIVGIKQSGVQLSYVLAGLALPTVAILSDWRLAFATTAVIPIAGIVGTHRLIPTSSSSLHDKERAAAAGDHRGNRWLIAYAFFMGAALGSIVAYLPLFSIQRVGFGAQAAGILMGMMSSVGVVVRILLGRHGESASHYARPLGVLALASFIGVGLVWLSEASTTPWMLWIAGVVMGASLLAWNSIGMLAVMRDAGHARTGRASGWVLAAFLGGFAASPTLFGYSVDLTGSYDTGWVGLLVLLALAMLSALVWLATAGDPARQS